MADTNYQQIFTSQLGSLLCSFTTILWSSGFETEAKASIQFHPIKQGPYAGVAREEGDIFFALGSPDEVMQMQFPQCLFILLPRDQARDIIHGAFAIRDELITKLEESQEEREEVDDVDLGVFDSNNWEDDDE